MFVVDVKRILALFIGFNNDVAFLTGKSINLSIYADLYLANVFYPK